MTHANNNHKEKSLKDLIEVELKKFKHYDLNQVFYVCPLDGTPSRSKHWLKAHMANKHNIGVDKHFPDKYIKKAKKALNQVWYFCFICDWKSRSHFNTKDHLINHIIQKHAFKP